jgi:predicted TIM-barrel fold metal-dependent hydrolase
MAWNGIPVIDGDGHVMEDWDALLQYMPQPYIESGRFKGRIFPRLDHQVKTGEKISDYVRRHVEAGRIFVGCEGTEKALHYLIQAVGNQPFMFSSDFPHEVNNEYCKHEIEEIVDNEHLSDDDKHAVLHRNAERFYGLKPLG